MGVDRDRLMQVLDRAHGPRIWMASEAVDMRCGFDRLAERVRAVFVHSPAGRPTGASVHAVVPPGYRPNTSFACCDTRTNVVRFDSSRSRRAPT